MADIPQFVIRDAAGRIYGPAALAIFRQWAAEGRLAATMEIAEAGSGQWRSVMTQPELAALLGTATQPASSAPGSSVLPATGGMAAPPSHPPAPLTSNAAIASLVCSIIGLLTFCPYPLALCALGAPAATLGIILGLLAQNHIRASQGRQSGAGLATLGIALGCLALFLTFATVVILFLYHPEMLTFMPRNHP